MLLHGFLKFCKETKGKAQVNNLFMSDYIKLYRDDIKREKDKSFISHYSISTCQVKSKRGLLRTCVMSFSSARKYRDQQTI